MTTSCPIESIRTAMAMSPKDWSLNHRDAWIYGIVLGWDDASLVEVSRLHQWDYNTISRLVMLRKKFDNMSEAG